MEYTGGPDLIIQDPVIDFDLVDRERLTDYIDCLIHEWLTAPDIRINGTQGPFID